MFVVFWLLVGYNCFMTVNSDIVFGVTDVTVGVDDLFVRDGVVRDFVRFKRFVEKSFYPVSVRLVLDDDLFKGLFDGLIRYVELHHIMDSNFSVVLGRLGREYDNGLLFVDGDYVFRCGV